MTDDEADAQGRARKGHFSFVVFAAKYDPYGDLRLSTRSPVIGVYETHADAENAAIEGAKTTPELRYYIARLFAETETRTVAVQSWYDLEGKP